MPEPHPLFPLPRLLTDDEAAQALARAIRGHGGGSLTREADLYLSTIAAERVWERLAIAGVVLAMAPDRASRGGAEERSAISPDL